MVVFSFLTLSNISRSTKGHQIHTSMIGTIPARIAPASMHTQNTPNLRRSKYGNQFLILSLLQILTFIILNSPRTCFRLFVALANPEATVGFANWSIFLSSFSSLSTNFVYIYTAVSYSI